VQACRWLGGHGWQVLYHNVLVAHVQVDILARDPKGVLTLVEVKLLSSMTHLSQRQKRRLFRAAHVLSGYEPVQLVLALVSGGNVRLLPVDGLTA